MNWIKEIRIGSIIDLAFYSHSTGYLYETSNINKIANKDLNIEAITLGMNRSFER